MNRHNIIETIGVDYMSSNIEKGEFSYPQAFSKAHKEFNSVKIGKHEFVDIRFIDDSAKFVLLVETKSNFDVDYEMAKKQLDTYMKYESMLTGYKMIGILANTKDGDNRIRVWKDRVSDTTFLCDQQTLCSFEEYRNLLLPIYTNNKEQVIRSTYRLNELLQGMSIDEELRSQFVGTCILALKYNAPYKELETAQIIAGIRVVLGKLLDDDPFKIRKLNILDVKVLDNQHIRDLSKDNFNLILNTIKKDIMPYINDKTTKGQDLLNLFFTTFNKYVGKKNKNQAFTPDHIVSFMCDVIGINRNSKILDPCCGSGAFLVRAMTDAQNDCQTDKERETVSKENIYGIEAEESAFGLSTTNMLIHSDGNSHIMLGSCFDDSMKSKIQSAGIDRVLMNPPYNATRSESMKSYADTWKESCKEDPSEGFHYLYYIAETVGKGKLAILLPMQCAIADSGEILSFKERMMLHHRLDAVFSFPPDMFHPGASAVACCMIWELGVRHCDKDGNPKIPTFFGYFRDDGFVKKKNLGRVERIDPKTGEGVWKKIKENWLRLYKGRIEEVGLSAIKSVNFADEWCAEAYMKTDYSKISEKDFINTMRNYAAYLVQKEEV